MSVTEIEIHPIRPEAALLPNGERVAASEGLTGGISAQASAPPTTPPMSRVRASVVVATVAGVSFLNTLGSGLLTVGLPRIAADLNLASNLLLWPASIFALTAGCTLLASGAIADVVGNRPVFLTGCALLSAFTLGCSLSQTGIQLIVFRALQGIAMSLCMPTAVSLITNNFPTGKRRNMAFAFLGGGQPIGFALGLVLGGILVDSIGWRVGYYISCGINALIFVGAFFSVPSPKSTNSKDRRKRLLHDIDWVGILIASACITLLSYVFAMITSSTSTIRHPTNIVLLAVAAALIPSFVFWVGRQERLGRPAIIPNSIWRKTEFTSVCITVFLCWAQFNAFGYFVTLFIQNIQHVTALQTSLRFLPLVVVGFGTNMLCGYLMDKVAASSLVLITSLLSAVSPLLFATSSPSWTYWAAAFPAMCLSPIASDVLFNVSNLIITASFKEDEQALAGGVFTTVSQLGNSIGLAMTALVASTVTMDAAKGISASPSATLEGYRAAFWLCFASAVFSCGIGSFGLRKSGKVGLKRE
jgi:MFS family permease